MNSKNSAHHKPQLEGWTRILVYAFFVMFAITMISVLILFVRQTQVRPDQPDETLNAMLEEAGVKDRVSVSVWRFLERDLIHNIYQNLPDGQTMDTPFAMGRTQDLFVALVVGSLVDRKLLTYEDELEKWFPAIDSRFREITIEQLLTHTSGIPARAEYETQVEALDLAVDPTRIDTYAPLNYGLLWQVVMQATGRSVPEWVDEIIVTPLELKNTDYRREPDGNSFYTSMADMGQLMRALNSNRIVSMKTLVRAFLPVKIAQRRSLYGHGWEVGPFYGIRMMRIDDSQWENVAFARFSLSGFMIAVHTDLPPEELHAGVLIEKVAKIYLAREMPQFGKPPQGEHEGFAAPPALLVDE